MEQNHTIFVLLGKSNTGKSTIFKQLMKLINQNGDNIDVLKSCTTRPKREEDHQENEYIFTTIDDFTKLHKSNGLLEYAVYNTVYGNWFYFTRKEDLKEQDYIKIINPVGYSQIRASLKHTNYQLVSFLIETEDNIRLTRAYERNDVSKEEIQRRFAADEKDFKYVKTDYVVKNNGDKSVEEVANAIYKILKFS